MLSSVGVRVARYQHVSVSLAILVLAAVSATSSLVLFIILVLFQVLFPGASWVSPWRLLCYVGSVLVSAGALYVGSLGNFLCEGIF